MRYARAISLDPGIPWFSYPGGDDVVKYARLAGSALRAGYTVWLVAFSLGISTRGHEVASCTSVGMESQ